MMDNNEVKFAKILEEIKYRARSAGGYIPKSDVILAFEELDLSKEQLDMVFDYLKKNNIGIDEPMDSSEYLSDEDMDILKEYEDELALIPEISDGQKRAYVMAAMNNDSSAKDKLVMHYLPKVIEISKLYSSQGVLLEDLIGEGNLAVAEGVGMLGALEEPDEADGMMIKLIMNAMEELISENLDEKTKDEKIAEKVNHVSEIAHELAQSFGRKVTVEELAENSKLSKKAIIDAVKMSSNKIEDIDYKED